MQHLLLVLMVICFPAWGLSSSAQEFMAIAKELEPVHCEKRKLRARFSELDRDPKTARLEKRLADLQRRMTLDAQDLDAISRQQREAYHRCE